MKFRTKRLLAICLVALGVLTGGCAYQVRAPETGPMPGPEPAQAWSNVLERFVDDAGRVDFTALAHDRADLDRFVAWVYVIGPDNAPQHFPTRAHVLAYHLNAYNALAMYNALQRGIPETLGGLELLRFFVFRQLAVGGMPFSLYAYENNVIRPLGEERLHFALNCMAVSCPRLPRRPFSAQTIEQDLEIEARRFFAEERNVQVDHATRVVRLSSILKFYPEDFLAKAPTLIAYANRYRTARLPEDYSVEFIPYDWTLNTQTRTR